jgi:hypothetical protein
MVDLLCWTDAYLIVTTDVPEAFAGAFFSNWRMRSTWAFSIFLCAGGVLRGWFAWFEVMLNTVVYSIGRMFPKAPQNRVEGGNESKV